ncbi:hypothetical protein [Bradyrhizobium sp.]|jgi:hypothetical protein|uniref:hypothetical protein n=1 Tax=Bradyrhizobium sp. TaxID=376 RepID=UPI003C2482C6
MAVSGKAIHENVRRYRAIASLYRQTAAFRPHQSRTLLEQAEAWEHLALRELEAYFALCDAPAYDRQPRKPADTGTRWPMAAAA